MFEQNSAEEIRICKNLFINRAYFSGNRSLQTLHLFLMTFESTEYMWDHSVNM